MKTKSLFIAALAALFLSLGTAYAQPENARFSPSDYKRKLESCLIKEASFTPEEWQKFFPIFHELRDKQRALNQEMHQLKRNIKKDTATEKDYRELLDKLYDLKEKVADLESDYVEKMCKAVPASKVYKALNAESRFHRQMLKKWEKGKKNDRPREGRGPRRK